jgi:MFS family permease
MSEEKDTPTLAEASPDVASPRDPYAALRSREFCLFLFGWMIGVVGDQILEMVVGWDLYQRTHSKLTLGMVGLVSAAPVILLALPAGHLADRFDRKRILLAALIFRCLSIVALAFVSYYQGPILAFYALLMAVATCRAIGWPARSAMLPGLVSTKNFPNAIAWNTSGFQISAMAGPALGGWILVGSIRGAYFVSAICGVIFALMLLGVRPRPVTRSQEPATLKSLVAGIRFVFNSKIILALITLDLFAVLLGGATGLFPVFAKDILHVGAVGFGWMRAAPALGALAMALSAAHLPPMKRAGRSMLWAIAGFGAATIVFGLSRNFWLSMAMLFLTGAFDNISVLVRHTLVQLLTPDSMRGRVSAVNNIFIGSSNDLGVFESGVTAQWWGPITSVVVGGIGTIVVVILTAMKWPEVLRFGSLHDAKPEPHAD